MQRRRLLAAGAQVGCGLLVVGRMGAAKQIFFIELALAQEGGRRRHVHRLTAVRAAGECDLLPGQVVLFHAAIFEEGDGLEGLGGGPEADLNAGITRNGQRAAPRVDDDDRAGVKGLELRAAVDVRQVHWAKCIRGQRRGVKPLPGVRGAGMLNVKC